MKLVERSSEALSSADDVLVPAATLRIADVIFWEGGGACEREMRGAWGKGAMTLR